VKNGAAGDIGGLQPRFGQKEVLYASDVTAHTLEVREAGEAVVSYGEGDVAAWKGREEVTGMPVGSFVTMPAKVLYSESKMSMNGPYVLSTVEYKDGVKEQVRMWQRDVAEVPVAALIVMHGFKVAATQTKDANGDWVAKEGADERVVECTLRSAVEVVQQDAFVMSLFE
jgi:hypothetical protein